VKVPAFVLMRVEGWKESSVPRSVPRVKSRRRRLRQEDLGDGLLVPSDVPDGLTIINGSEIAAQFEIQTTIAIYDA
jgi:hypothetical protein